MGKRFRRIVSIFCMMLLIGASMVPPVFGKEVTKSGVIVKEVNQNAKKQAEEQKTSQLSDEILVVKYKTPLSQAELQSSNLQLIKHLPSLKTAVVKLKNKKNMNEVIRKFSKMDHIESIQPSALYKTLSSSSDPKASKQYYLSMLNIEKAHSLAGKEKVRVAVIDQGVDMNHPELAGKLLPSYNAVNPMSAGIAGFHGTHVTGIIASNKDNGIGGYGINPNVEILPIDVFDGGYWAVDYAIAQGILHAIEKKAKVINLSLGGYQSSQILEDAVKKAVDQGIVVVAAAGNSGSEILEYPASFEGVISVGSIDEKKKLAYDSTYGPAIDVVAPGVDIYNTLYEPEKKSSFREMSGTSMASPMVAGVASLLLSKHPTLKPVEIDYILKHTADDLGEKGADIKYGYGLINPVKALQFDPKNIPAAIKNGNVERQKAIEKAELIDIDGEKTINNKITKPGQENWVKVNVKAGQTMQIQLSGKEQYDYKIIGKWLDTKKEDFEINEVGHGITEGALLEIEQDGILALGVKDVFGQYDEQSAYQLRIVSTYDVPESQSDRSNPIEIPTLPGKITDQTLFAPNNEVDEDYYSLKVDKPQVIKVALSGLPGVDSAISVYQKDLMMDIPGISKEELETLMFMAPIKYENRKGKSEGETLLFSAQPDIEYIVKVSNQPEFFYGFFEFFMDLSSSNPKPMSSLDPYEITFEGHILPEDEDQFSMGGLLGEEESALAIEQTMFEQPISYIEMMKNQTEMIKNIAIPVVSEWTEGYLQMEGDQDWYQYYAEADGLYKLDLKKDKLKPSVEVSQLATDKMEDEEYEYFQYIGYNNDWWSYDVKDEIYLSLEKGQTYYIRIEANYMNNSGINIDPYEFRLKKIADIKKDPYEPNDEFEDAKDLKATKITSTFSKASDTDNYYLQAKESAIYGVTLSPIEATKQLKAAYPEEVLKPYSSFIVIYEDVNKNRKLDDSELENARYIEKSVYSSGKTFGSFQAKKGAHYFISASGYIDSNVSFSLLPYELTVQPIVLKDEDPYNTGVSISKVKPMNMKQKANNQFESVGYFNADQGYGDEDWYAFTMKNNGKATITLEAPLELDGQLEIYQNRRLVKSVDFYPEGDAEVAQLTLNKGEYWIKVKEVYNQTSIDPYKLTVKVE